MLLALVPGAAAQVTFDPGSDCWTTNSSTSTAQLPGGSPTAFFPVGFFKKGMINSAQFGPVTIPVMGVPLGPGDCPCTQPPAFQWTDRHGNPVQPGDKHGVNQVPIPTTADTCVQRTTPANLTGVGTPAPVNIVITRLHLKSVSPLAVPMSDATTCFYDVDILLSGSQSAGSMSLTPTNANLLSGTANLSSLPVGFTATYTPAGPCDARAPVPGLSTTFSNTPGAYSLPSPPGRPGMSAAGVAALLTIVLIGMGLSLRRRRRAHVEA